MPIVPTITRTMLSKHLRSQRLTSDTNFKQETKQKVKDIFIQNGYGEKHIDRIFQNCDSQTTSTTTNNTKKDLFWPLPYIHDMASEIKTKTQRINKMLTNTTIKIAYRTFKTQHMCKNKDLITKDETSSVVYKFQCEHCPACYIGETRRQLHKRIKEHLTGRPLSEISLHVHPPSAKNFSVLAKTKYTRIAETLLIKKHSHDGTELINNNKASDFLHLF